MTVETTKEVLADLIQFMLADRGVQVEAVSVVRVENPHAETNWEAKCVPAAAANPERVDAVLRNMMPTLRRKYRLR